MVVGQILYSGTLQYLREYGTLKAMGARIAEFRKGSSLTQVQLAETMGVSQQTVTSSPSVSS